MLNNGGKIVPVKRKVPIVCSDRWRTMDVRMVLSGYIWCWFVIGVLKLAGNWLVLRHVQSDVTELNMV